MSPEFWVIWLDFFFFFFQQTAFSLVFTYQLVKLVILAQPSNGLSFQEYVLIKSSTPSFQIR